MRVCTHNRHTYQIHSGKVIFDGVLGDLVTNEAPQHLCQSNKKIQHAHNGVFLNVN